MARFNRRVTYPLYDPNDVSVTGILTNVVADASFQTVKVGGVIRVRGSQPPNRTAVFLTNPYLYKVAAGRYKSSGTSPFYGSRV